jgi:hypothetical protein
MKSARDRHQAVQVLCVVLILSAVPRLIGVAIGRHGGAALPIACWSLVVGIWGVVTTRPYVTKRLPRAIARDRSGERRDHQLRDREVDE